MRIDAKNGAEEPMMRRKCRFGLILFIAFIAGSLMSWVPMCLAQAPEATKADAPVATNPAGSGAQLEALPKKGHRFWDKENDWLFAGVGASRTLDYFSTLNMRRRGRQEIFLTNDVVDNHAGFAAIEASATGISIGASYLFHRYGHHKLERWTSIVHIGLTTTGAVRNYCLKTAHLAVTPSAP
jgi:hypothetical protein